MSTSNIASLMILRRAAQNAAADGHFAEAQGIYKRVLTAIERAYGKSSDEYRECVTEAARALHPALSKEAANG
jgi:hypothetical protein